VAKEARIGEQRQATPPVKIIVYGHLSTENMGVCFFRNLFFMVVFTSRAIGSGYGADIIFSFVYIIGKIA
jgi:hypothetical protein